MPHRYARSAAEIQEILQKALGHDQVKVKPHGEHYLIQLEFDEGLETIARITILDGRTFGAAFRSHRGRWEILPVEGSREEMIQVVVDWLGPYLMPANY